MRALSGLRLTCLGLILSSVGILWGQRQPVELTGLAFSKDNPPGFRQQWLEVALELRCGEILGTGQDYNRQIGVRLRAAWEVRSDGSRPFEFYESSVVLAALEERRVVVVYFYLPPEIVERDRLDAEPFAWQVELSVEGRVLPNRPGMYSENLANPAAAQSFLRRLEEQKPTNAGHLQPIFLTPFFRQESGRFERLPTFLREELPPGSEGRQ